MAKAKTTAKPKYNEIDEIRDDLNSLKNNVVELSRHLKSDGLAKTESAKASALSRLDDVKAEGQRRVGQIEGRVKAKPAESVAVAFAAGLAASLLLRRK